MKKLKKYTEIIINQSNKLNEHIEKILNSAKSDNSPLKLVKKKVSIIPILENSIENIKLKYENVSIKIASDAKEYFVELDEFHFSNLVYNLLDNSVKYCENNPEIFISLSQKNNSIQLEFIDNGIGISKNNINLIFDKFYRIPSIKSNEINGFGLGLYYVKKICALHHWKIIAKNNAEKGITISIVISINK
jgi:two-component system, OmpR family, phosphate regulon sensor histidine kinase PhoR